MNTYKHIVQYYETDKMQVTHHSNYIRFMEEARVVFMDNIGWNYKKLEDEGIMSPVIGINCEYKKTTTFMDEINIEVNVASINAAKLKVAYIMSVNDEIVCKAESTHCFINMEGRPISIKRQYPEFYAILESNAEEWKKNNGEISSGKDKE